ncbi:MAG TPA: GlsB/YeaQ/YmgE family stress response membrane protein [Abditibacteriaceae bacterium]
MSIVGWIILGALAGWIASMIMGTNNKQGCLTDIVLGILGAVVGGFVYSLVTNTKWQTEFNIPSIIVAVVGACIVIGIKKMITGRR